MNEYTICVFGSGGVGKSCLTMRFVQGNFVEKYDPTIEDVYKKTLEIDGKQYALEILDTAGSEEFSTMRDLYVGNGHGFVLVYSITSPATFTDIQRYYSRIVALKNVDENTVPPIVLVGNKCDSESERAVSREDGQNLARKWKCSFLESSAKTKINVAEIFYDLVRQINRTRQGAGEESVVTEPTHKNEARAVINSDRSTSQTTVGADEKKKGCCVLL